jgi:hypothetical protein
MTTRCLRAVFDASTDGVTYAAVALQEWAVFADRARAPRRPSVKGAATANCSWQALTLRRGPQKRR